MRVIMNTASKIYCMAHGEMLAQASLAISSATSA